MAIELRILSGALAGQHPTFDASVVAIGRHPQSDLRFDPTKDIDVSTQHAEIAYRDGRYVLTDKQSRNGTLINGERVPAGGSQQLYDGDVISFGAKGPRAEVRGAGPRPPGESHGAMRTTTAQRIAVAVKEQTRGLRILMVVLVIALCGLGGGAWWMGHREALLAEAQIRDLIRKNDAASVELQAHVRSTNDTAFQGLIQRKLDSLRATQQTVSRRGDSDHRRSLEETQRQLEELAAIDLPAIGQENDPAVVLIQTRIGTTDYEATGFSIAANGLIVTNRHVVEDSVSKATKIQVKFANTRVWMPTHIVKVADDPTVDLALIQVDASGHYPAVSTVSAKPVDSPVGGAIVTLGFPLGTDLAMEGSGTDLEAKTTMTSGHISKTLPDLLQIDAFAGHGSSGSPVFDTHGHVIGVIYGGPPGAAGRIVYAVPSDRIIELRKAAGL